jgi:hypothetical protein
VWDVLYFVLRRWHKAQNGSRGVGGAIFQELSKKEDLAQPNGLKGCPNDGGYKG